MGVGGEQAAMGDSVYVQETMVLMVPLRLASRGCGYSPALTSSSDQVFCAKPRNHADRD